MSRSGLPTLIIALIAILVVFYLMFFKNDIEIPSGDAVPLSEIENKVEVNINNNEAVNDDAVKNADLKSNRKVFVTDGVKHSIPTEEIRQGCFGRDCIPSVDEPVFVDIEEADLLFRTAGEKSEDVIGIALSFNGGNRFYPFNMLVTKEIVNDVIGGQAVAVTYCPLCGTGIVFNRKRGDEVLEFGVSGFLWQSNLLMYNRNEDEDKVSLWSQVLGEAVLGNRTGDKLSVIPSDIMKFGDWQKDNPKGEVLNAGKIGDPYNGDYYGVATRFEPNFNESDSPIDPTEYVFGIEIDGRFKAYVSDSLELGVTDDMFNGVQLRIDKGESGIVRISSGDRKIPIVTGFWFSWSSAHPETELYNK